MLRKGLSHGRAPDRAQADLHWGWAGSVSCIVCSFSQQLVRAMGKSGVLLLRAPPMLQKGKEIIHFGLDLVHGATVSYLSFVLI